MTPERAQLEDVLRSLGDVRYADVRYTATHAQDVKVRNGEVDHLASTVDRAVGVRVLVGNGWGFAATSDVSEETIRRTARRALEVAAASNLASTQIITLSDVEPHVARWESHYEIDPWSVPIEKKLEHLMNATEPMRGDPRIHQVSGDISCYRQEKVFASTIGSFIEQTTTQMGGGIEAVAIDEGEFQRRTYPNPFGGDFQAEGWEFIERLDLPKKALEIRDEALQLLAASKAPAGRFDLIVGSAQLALQVHESCGHPTELDRAMGLEISLAGGSFLQPQMLGHFRYGSDLVNIVADATIPGSIGSFAFDDDGVPAQRFHLVRDGTFVDYLTGRDTAPFLGRVSNGTVRAETAARIPIIRMTNINLEPGTTPLADLIADTKRGIFVETNKSWSIDDLRLNFQFGCEVAWEIENGRLTRLLKNPLYTGNTPDFWRSCDAVGDRASWQIWGLPNCGKGDPMQTMRVAHGAPAARFRNVEMG
ncbi:MAG: TldD/PmbA family protein [Acidobacteria bacterium]|nr:TldD/PmbA family protein [Acidobacteriota bacterium]MBV9478281.1 TldD/PmbA family protein [Acidobacteriota bacterium]